MDFQGFTGQRRVIMRGRRATVFTGFADVCRFARSGRDLQQASSRSDYAGPTPMSPLRLPCIPIRKKVTGLWYRCGGLTSAKMRRPGPLMWSWALGEELLAADKIVACMFRYDSCKRAVGMSG